MTIHFQHTSIPSYYRFYPAKWKNKSDLQRKKSFETASRLSNHVLCLRIRLYPFKLPP